MMAVAGSVADACHALWAEGVEVPFVKGEVCVTESAGDGVSLAGCSASRAANHRGVVRCRNRHLESAAAEAVEPVSGLEMARVVLPLAGRAGNEQPHANRMVQTHLGVN